MDIFLGEPSPNVKQWIIEHSTSPGHPETRFTLDNGTVETYNITGTLNRDWMIDNGYWDDDNEEWIKTITQADIGNAITSIGDWAFSDSELMSVTIPNSVTNIGECAFHGCSGLASVMILNGVTNIGNYAFAECNNLTSVTFNSFTKNQIKTMTTEDYLFGEVFYSINGEPMAKSFTIVCTDGSMTINFSADEPATITFTDL